MSEEDANHFLELLRADPDAPFRADRMAKLESYTKGIARAKLASKEWERTWKAAANEYIELTDKWLALGAKWRCKGAYTVWEYDGERFYMWWSRTLVTDNIEGARKADARLAEIISRKQANR